jgi:hypothetical protein
MKQLYQALVRQPQDEEGMSMSKNGNKIAVVGRASRVACAAMTVTAAAMLTASTLLAEPLEQTSPDAMIQALQGAFGAHPGFRKNHAKGTCATGSFVGLLEATSYSRSALFSGATIPVVAKRADVPRHRTEDVSRQLDRGEARSGDRPT